MAGSNPDRGRTVSTVLGRRLGGELLRMREACDLRQSHAADALTASVAKVAKIERGPRTDTGPRHPGPVPPVRETDADTVDRLLALAKADRERRKASGLVEPVPGA
ncbi:helix-turn-helix domain-containing protein [Streptomyces sp. CYG21]|nr:helix-turn-helix domain-containing protein [Streptomyces sp. CYG21]